MLPLPHELREMAERIQAALPNSPTDEMKQVLAGHALRLVQVAEQLERTNEMDALVHGANIERYERLLAGALDEKTRSVVETLLSEEKDRPARLVGTNDLAVNNGVTDPQPLRQDCRHEMADDFDHRADEVENHR